ncbi:MAG: cytochrome ubiquinol oxidase subunit I, partial [Gemmatimonadales bacterium]
TIGALVFMAGALITLVNLVHSRRHGPPAGDNPWQANTLEWATASPPEHYDFARIPIVTGRDPLWDGGVTPGPALDDGRKTPRTTVLDAEWEAVAELPEQNVWAVILPVAMLVFCAGALVRNGWLMAAAGVVVVGSMLRWMWPAHRYVLETEL